MHLEVLVEEPSAEEALKILIPRMLGADVSFAIHSFQGKKNLLDKLPARLRGYRYWPDDTRIVVLIDTDNADCYGQKNKLEQIAHDAGLFTKTHRSKQDESFCLVNRLAIQELEAWFLGDIPAIRAAYPHIPKNLERKQRYRKPDAIRDTWEELEKILQRAGYFKGGLKKIEAAKNIAPHMEPERNCSPSFQTFYQGLLEVIT